VRVCQRAARWAEGCLGCCRPQAAPEWVGLPRQTDTAPARHSKYAGWRAQATLPQPKPSYPPLQQAVVDVACFGMVRHALDLVAADVVDLCLTPHVLGLEAQPAHHPVPSQHAGSSIEHELSGVGGCLHTGRATQAPGWQPCMWCRASPAPVGQQALTRQHSLGHVGALCIVAADVDVELGARPFKVEGCRAGADGSTGGMQALWRHIPPWAGRAQQHRFNGSRAFWELLPVVL